MYLLRIAVLRFFCIVVCCKDDVCWRMVFISLTDTWTY